MTKYCKCGCGTEIADDKTWAHGHNPNRRGVKLSGETKEKMRQSSLRENLSIETLEKMRQSQLGTKKSDESKEKNRISTKKQWENLFIRGKMINGINKYWENPLAHEKTSKGQKKRYEDPKEHEKTSDGLKKHHVEHPETAESMSKSMKKHYENPLAHEVTSKTVKKHHENHPETGIKMSESGKKSYKENPIRAIESSRWMTGENHWNWQGGITSEHMKLYNSSEYKEWRTTIFKRDNYTCQICGLSGIELNSHHIFKFSDYKELRFEINNGITLCKKCHQEKVNHHEKEYEIELLSKIFDNKGLEIFGELEGKI